jgi:hypothetical protein
MRRYMPVACRRREAFDLMLLDDRRELVDDAAVEMATHLLGQAGPLEIAAGTQWGRGEDFANRSCCVTRR